MFSSNLKRFPLVPMTLSAVLCALFVFCLVYFELDNAFDVPSVVFVHFSVVMSTVISWAFVERAFEIAKSYLIMLALSALKITYAILVIGFDVDLLWSSIVLLSAEMALYLLFARLFIKSAYSIYFMLIPIALFGLGQAFLNFDGFMRLLPGLRKLDHIQSLLEVSLLIPLLSVFNFLALSFFINKLSAEQEHKIPLSSAVKLPFNSRTVFSIAYWCLGVLVFFAIFGIVAQLINIIRMDDYRPVYYVIFLKILTVGSYSVGMALGCLVLRSFLLRYHQLTNKPFNWAYFLLFIPGVNLFAWFFYIFDRKANINDEQGKYLFTNNSKIRAFLIGFILFTLHIPFWQDLDIADINLITVIVHLALLGVYFIKQWGVTVAYVIAVCVLGIMAFLPELVVRGGYPMFWPALLFMVQPLYFAGFDDRSTT